MICNEGASSASVNRGSIWSRVFGRFSTIGSGPSSWFSVFSYCLVSSFLSCATSSPDMIAIAFRNSLKPSHLDSDSILDWSSLCSYSFLLSTAPVSCSFEFTFSTRLDEFSSLLRSESWRVSICACAAEPTTRMMFYKNKFSSILIDLWSDCSCSMMRLSNWLKTKMRLERILIEETSFETVASSWAAPFQKLSSCSLLLYCVLVPVNPESIFPRSEKSLWMTPRGLILAPCWLICNDWDWEFEEWADLDLEREESSCLRPRRPPQLASWFPSSLKSN